MTYYFKCLLFGSLLIIVEWVQIERVTRDPFLQMVNLKPCLASLETWMHGGMYSDLRWTVCQRKVVEPGDWQWNVESRTSGEIDTIHRIIVKNEPGRHGIVVNVAVPCV